MRSNHEARSWRYFWAIIRIFGDSGRAFIRFDYRRDVI